MVYYRSGDGDGGGRWWWCWAVVVVAIVSAAAATRVAVVVKTEPVTGPVLFSRLVYVINIRCFFFPP